MKKGFIGIFIFLTALILPLFNADAATYHLKKMPVNSFIGRVYSGMTIGGRNSILGYNGGYNTLDVHFVEDEGSIYHGYCLHLGKQIYSDAALGIHKGFDDLIDSSGNAIGSDKQSVLKNILASGYQNVSGNENDFMTGSYRRVGTCVDAEKCSQVLATQLLIWEVLAGGRNNYDREPQGGNDAYVKFIKDDANSKLKLAYDNILNNAESLTRKDNFPASGKTYVLNWSDAEQKYVSSPINVANYNILNPNINGISVNRDSDNTVKVYSNEEITNPIKIDAKLVKGNSLESSETFRWYRFINHSDAQDVLMGNYSVPLNDSFNVKTEIGKFLISKVDSETKKILKGSKFNLYKCSGSNCFTKEFLQEIDLTTSAQTQEVTIKKSGTYLFEETVVPYGYTGLGQFMVDFVINSESGNAEIRKIYTNSANIQKMDDGSLRYYSLVIENKAKEIIVNKVDGNTNAPINGATFQIKDSKGNLVKFDRTKSGIYRYSSTGTITNLVDSSKSQYNISLLPEGEYTIVEIAVPYPYVLAGNKNERETKIKIDKNADLWVYNYTTKSYNKSTNATITIKNFKTSLVIKKTGTKGVPLANVKFELYDSSKSKQIILMKNETTNEYEYVENQKGTPIQIITDTAGKAVIKYLPAGKYFLKETVTVEGYTIDETNEWTAIQIKVGRNNAPEVNKTISNAKNEFSFYKIDEDGNYISDGKFKLQVYNEKASKYEDVPLVYHKEDNVYTIDKTGKSNVYIFTPIDGMATFKDIDSKTKYRVVEIEAPEGFVLPKSSEAEVELEVNENGYVIGDTILINKKITVEEEATAQAELVINISTGQERVRYLIIIGGIVVIIAGLFIINRKLKK